MVAELPLCTDRNLGNRILSSIGHVDAYLAYGNWGYTGFLQDHGGDVGNDITRGAERDYAGDADGLRARDHRHEARDRR